MKKTSFAGLVFACFNALLACSMPIGIASAPRNEIAKQGEHVDMQVSTALDNESAKNMQPVEKSPADMYVEQLLETLTIEEKIGQLLNYRLPSGTTEFSDETANMIESLKPGGFTLFAENVVSIEQVQALTLALQEKSDIPLHIAVDEEGGRVSRIGRLYEEAIPSAYRLSQSGDIAAVYNASYTIATRLLELGINMNFAPIADIWSNDANTVIGDRAYGRDEKTASLMVEAAVKAYKDLGVLSVLKHFPGHGDTAEDSHIRLAVNNFSLERFDNFEAIPFKSGIKAGSEGIMIGHIATPLISGEEDKELPATLSPYWLSGVLREEWGYNGLIITDAMEMKGITNYYSTAEAVLLSFLAGTDILLMPEDATAAYNSLLEAYNDGTISEERLNESVSRILYSKFGLG